MEKQKGFTLIELVMVIVILGVLSAVALPKFANLSQDARHASLVAAHGTVLSAMNIVHSKAIVDGKETLASSTIELEGATLDIVYGYPSRGTNESEGIAVAAGIADSFLITYGGGVAANIHFDGYNQCKVLYREATATGPATITSPVDKSNC